MNTNKKRVFICSPYRINEHIKNTKEYAERCCIAACEKGVAPFAPHAFYTNFLDDDNPDARTIGMECGIAYLAICEELWVCSTYISEGMQQEIDFALSKGIAVKHYFETLLD